MEVQVLLATPFKNMITYKKAQFDEKTVSRLIELSKQWVDEDSCFGMVTNTKEDLKEPCFVALDNDLIVGYVFGHFYELEKKVTPLEAGTKCFEVDELYVIPEYRSKGIGGQLFSLVENEAKKEVNHITLATSNKDYKKVLKFYAEKNGMVFHSAFLVKDLK